eukprot:252606_1
MSGNAQQQNSTDTSVPPEHIGTLESMASASYCLNTRVDHNDSDQEHEQSQHMRTHSIDCSDDQIGTHMRTRHLDHRIELHFRIESYILRSKQKARNATNMKSNGAIVPPQAFVYLIII